MMNYYMLNIQQQQQQQQQNNMFTFSYKGNQRPKMLYIDIIGNTKPGCKRCGK